MALRDSRVLQIVAAGCGAVWVWAAVAPFDRFDWLLENILSIAAIAYLFRISREAPLSERSYVLIAIFFVLHTVGSHYTYSLVPFGDWMKGAMGLDRNHYDRIVHFSFGLLLARSIRELIIRSTAVVGGASYLFTATIVAACSEIYELIEFGVAQIVSPEAAMAYLGTQGDPFDAQKDTGLALTGAIIALTVIRLGPKRASSNP